MSHARALNRRTFLAGSLAAAAGATTGLSLTLGPGPTPARTAAVPAALEGVAGNGRAAQAPAKPLIGGTTLRTVSAAGGHSGYRQLSPAPGWQRVIRNELARGRKGRTERRTALASFVQFTDLHIVDVQHPLRYEYMRAANPTSWRPQEALALQGTVALIERVNALGSGPATGVAPSFVMTTGDNTDNNSQLELEWYLQLMSGGRARPNSGDPRSYEGVQNSGLELYWQPGSGRGDADKRLGFPRIDGFLEAATREVDSPGLGIPWYGTVGNHDVLPGGCYASRGGFLAEFAVGSRKLETLPGGQAEQIYQSLKKGYDPRGSDLVDLLRSQRKRMRTVTPDPRRAPFTRSEYVAAHLDPRFAGAGPVGHGYTEAGAAEDRLYYSFRISPDVIGISLDTTDPAGHYTGSLGTAQLRWLERTLKANKDSYALVFSHHTSLTMDNSRPDPERPGEQRHNGEEVLAVLGRNRNAVAWINGHIHRNAITPHGSFWEISTASHIDFPQLARIIELTDNGDGTLSLFTTLIESAAPSRADFGDLSQRGLASLYRELAFNAPQPVRRRPLNGSAADRNTELLLPKP